MDCVGWNYGLVSVFIWRVSMVEGDADGRPATRGGLVLVHFVCQLD